MIQTIVKARKTVRGKLLLTVIAVLGSVALPQLVHVVGRLSGVGTALGELLLPMHFFVLLAGLLAGPAVGMVTGACAPLVSYLLSGMPREAVLPFMLIELVGYGLIAGLMSEVKMHSFVKLLVAQVGGRVLRAAAVLIAVYGFHLETVSVSSISNMIVSGVIGILLQWCILPLILFRLNASEDRE
ncbi:MAG: ECF transporter S component [Clostridia bacterium]|nr:ECF transporter S component [Clostridia bacterium]